MSETTQPAALATIEELVTLATNLGESDQDYVEARALQLLDQLVLDVRRLVPASDFREHSIEAPDARALRSIIAERFPRWGQYNTVMTVTEDVGDAELAIGHAQDDLTDIIGELMVVRQAATHHGWEQAQWLLLDGYYNFWRGPLRSLQLFVHYLELEQNAPEE